MQQLSNSKIPSITIEDPTPLPGNGKFHVKLIEGFYQNLRRIISWPMLALFFGLTWLRIDNLPVVLFDFSAHRIFLFGIELSWYDLPILAGIMISGASLLFFMAVGWGRVWCGFACPQSIWTWLFIRIEDMVEGRAAKRAKAEESGLTGLALVRRAVKHSLWLMLSFATAITFSGYFVPIDQLLANIITLEASLFSLSWIIVMALLTYANAGLVREKVCLHMCPYSRFQGVMFDNKTRTVTYDKQRGEPRSHRRNAEDNTGDCIDCGICVQVCPTGIDIRNGLQAACIDCAACIDACDSVMVKLGKAKGLIEFYSEEQLSHTPNNSDDQPKDHKAHTTSRVLSPRLLGYLAVFSITLIGVFYSLQNRTELLIEIAKERGSLYQISGDSVCNNFRIELEAFSDNLSQLQIAVNNQNGSTPLTLIGPKDIYLTEQNNTLLYRVCAPLKEQPARSKIDFTFSNSTFSSSKQSTFIAPHN